ncbi:hypothetical protein G6F68_018999 [Rhizopus microsporus]|nr:hypothetical protein G6F68_018999 [Rhizopus microsporus]
MPRRLKSPGSVASTEIRMGSMAEERGKDGEDGQRSQVIQPGVRYDLVAQPLARLRRQQGGAQADTHAEHDHRAPWDARLHVFPRHHAKARQHQQDQAESTRTAAA